MQDPRIRHPAGPCADDGTHSVRDTGERDLNLGGGEASQAREGEDVLEAGAEGQGLGLDPAANPKVSHALHPIGQRLLTELQAPQRPAWAQLRRLAAAGRVGHEARRVDEERPLPPIHRFHVLIHRQRRAVVLRLQPPAPPIFQSV